VVKSGWDTIKRNPLTAVDSFDFGILIFEVFNGSFLGGDQVGLTKNVPPSMQQSYKRLVNTNPKLRLSVGHFLEQGTKGGGFFETPLIRLTQGIESLGLKNEAEREEFLGLAPVVLSPLLLTLTWLFRELDDLSDDFPEEFFKMKVLPELLKSIEFGGGGPRVMGVIMKIGARLSDDEFESSITPVIVRLFASPDRAMRVCLLDNLPSMIDRLPQKVVNDKIFPQMVSFLRQAITSTDIIL
jgi:SCY1-like protein 1